MGSAPSQKDAASPATEAEVAAEAPEPQKSNQMPKDHHSDDNICVCDGASPSKKRRRAQSGEAERDPPVNGVAVSEEQTQESEEKVEASEENGHVEDEKEVEKEQVDGDVVSNGIKEREEQEKEATEAASEEVQVNGERVEEQEKQKGDTALTSEGVTAAPVPAPVPAPAPELEPVPTPEPAAVLESVPSPAVHAGVDMVFPEDEVPIELYLFSSDGSAEEMLPESPPRKSNKSLEAESKTAAATPTTPAAALPTSATPAPPATPTDTVQTPAPVTAEESVTRTVGKRKRRKKLSYSAPRSKAATKGKQEQNNVPASPALENKLSISVNGHAAENGVDTEAGEKAPPSPVYPDAVASHLYPSTPEGEPWRWEDVDPYFDPLAQSDLDNLVRWRKENADFVAVNSNYVSGMESKRAVLESMLADASDASTAHVDIPVRRGRSYRDVWEERDFLDQQKRDNSVGETHQVVKMKMKRRGAVDSESSVLESHRDLVYGYDDDLFQKFRGRLEDRVKTYQTTLPPATRLQDAMNDTSDMSADEIVFDEEVLPNFPTHQLHPASLGLWKLRKNQEPVFTVVHPASVNRAKVPTRWKEEMKRHHQRQYEFQLQQTDELADPSDGDDEGTGDTAHDRLRATISNSEVTDELLSFGNCVEEDEISQALAASMRKLIPLSIYNWRTAQLVYERAACSIQCAPILEGEAAAARELEDVFLQLCPPEDSNVDITVPGADPARQPRTQINSAPYDMIAYSVRHDIADNCSLAVAASVEFALGLSVGDVVDVLDRNGCWNYGEVVETYSESRLGISKFLLMRFSLWSEDTVEWIAANEGRILPQGVADGSRSCSVGPTRTHRVRVRYDQNLARQLERSFPQRQARQATAASQMLAQRQHNVVIGSSTDQQKTPQKRKRKRPANSTAVTATT
ncbi:hypothetical protein PC129_g6070 [Phytophthora cactorum]|uniref:Uncharacterized protein n=1 Tax=Phytophthora cactorum TaxID=29920 RepID=A0A329SWG2_9STRA|nr:hypothetical protein Pcac1_g12494 [Phytophthora cactorum]KAG2831977.1 hypothetical protein PC111_g6787 [Phytophthora cactorum]KAG2849750.1 hypothetical protein PC112_g136 [Phytophthora cactorum]KAG2860379.1 hypothetical protein PC113_g8115 [Phytophthora cactorum]KAG2926979.1 hypothetical protein PC115_g7724 [Phytophthora cactorum]